MEISVYRKGHFNAAHRLHVPDWSIEKNKEVFGLCNNENFHGHNYELEVKLTGQVDPVSGYLIDLKEVKDIIDREVINCFDHKNLNLDCIEFININPTAENIAIVIWNKIRPYIKQDLKLSIKLFETERNYVEYHGN